jgi:hypothetical protein
MSSLRLQGQWTTASATALNPLSGQTACGLSFWFRANSTLPGTCRLVFGDGDVPFLTFNNNSGQLSIQLRGAVGSNFNVNASYTVGFWTHVLITWAPGAQACYVNSVLVGSATISGGMLSSAGHLNLGPTSSGLAAGTIDLSFAELAYWHGYTPTSADDTALVYRTALPWTLGTPCTHGWSLYGTGSVVNPTTDAGFLDQVGGTLRFAAATGPGPASYSPDTPVYVPPHAVKDVYTGKSGQTLFVLPQISTTTIGTTPTLTVNGTPTTITLGPVETKFWCFGLPAPVQPTDSLVLTAPLNWIAGTPAVNATVRNLVGKREYPIPASPIFKLGFNQGQLMLAEGSALSIVANAVRRIRWTPGDIAARDSLGNPTQFTGGKTSTSAPTGAGGPGGRFTLSWDSTDGVTDINLSGTGVTYHPELSNPSGAAGIGRTRVYDVPVTGASIVLSNASSTPNFQNLQLVPTGNSPSADLYAYEANALGNLSLPGGGGPAAMRFMDSCAFAGDETDQAAAADLVGSSYWYWAEQLGTTASVTLTTIRPVDTSVSPNIIAAGGPYPWPAGWPGNGKNLFWGGTYVAEVTTATPHPFYTGQARVTINLGSVTSIPLVGGGTVTISGSFTAMVFVTSATSFVFIGGVTGGNGTAIASTQTITGGSASVNPVNSGQFLPPQFAAASAARFPNCYCWLNIPRAATDAYVTALANAVAGFNCKFIIEYADEPWNGQFSVWYLSWAMTNILGGINTGGVGHGWIAKRSLQIKTVFQAAMVANGRPATDALMGAFPQFGEVNGGLVDAMIAEYNAGHGSFDVMGPAPYADWNYSLSLTTSWSIAQHLDVMRAFFVYSNLWNITYLADFTAGVARYEAAIGKRVTRFAYEGDIETVGAVAGGGHNISNWDWMYHPDIADTEYVLWTTLQNAGFDGMSIYNFLDAPRSNNNNWTFQDYQYEQAGAGLSNTLDGAQVIGNQSVRMYAYQQWQAGVSPTPTPTPTPTPPPLYRRRWFPSLRHGSPPPTY